MTFKTTHLHQSDNGDTGLTKENLQHCEETLFRRLKEKADKGNNNFQDIRELMAHVQGMYSRSMSSEIHTIGDYSGANLPSEQGQYCKHWQNVLWPILCMFYAHLDVENTLEKLHGDPQTERVRIKYSGNAHSRPKELILTTGQLRCLRQRSAYQSSGFVWLNDQVL